MALLRELCKIGEWIVTDPSILLGSFEHPYLPALRLDPQALEEPACPLVGEEYEDYPDWDDLIDN